MNEHVQNKGSKWYQSGSRKIVIWEAVSKLEFRYQKYEVVDGGKILKHLDVDHEYLASKNNLL